MGVLKDALHLAVLQHLRTQRGCQTLVLSLNAPQGIGPASIRTAWSALKENGKDEGMKKASGLQSVLRERLDVFHFHTNEKGHNLITLTPAVMESDPASPLPPKGPAYTAPAGMPAGAAAQSSDLSGLLGGFPAITAEEAADPELFAEAMKAVEQLQAAEAMNPGIIASVSEPKAKKAKLGGTYTGGTQPAGGKGKGKTKFGLFSDIVWTPQWAAQKEGERQKDAEMARALFNAANIHGGKAVTISQLGADYNVSQLKKDPQFRNHKLIDILRFHENVFELVADNQIGGFVVSVQPGGEAALPDADTFFEELNETMLLLPERIEEPRSQAERMQALRIELCHVLYKRGQKAGLNELGQDQKVQKVKTGLPKTLKMIEFIKMFPLNFTISPSITAGLFDVSLASADCYDKSMIENNLQRQQEMTQRFRDKGKGKGGSSMGSSRPMQPSLGSGYDAHAANAHAQQAVATATYLNAIMQQSQASAYGAAPPGFGAAQPLVGQPPAGAPGSSGFGFGYSI